MKADLIIKSNHIFNSYYKKFFPGMIAVRNGIIVYVGPVVDDYTGPETDLKNKYIIPGFVDIHMHIESSMASPATFSDIVKRCGVTTLVSEPHEIANVFGLDAVKKMIEAGDRCEVDIFYGIPSSVPSTSSDLETTGGVIDVEDVRELLKYPQIVCLGEVMNTRGVLNDPELKAKKFIELIKKERPSLTIEGHVPRIKGVELATYLLSGIDSDHTEHTFEEVKDRFMMGMFFELQHKMMDKELIDYIVENDLYERFCFVTDDIMADVLLNEGHINKLVKDAIALGMPAEYAIYCATYTSAVRMKLLDRGTISPGRIADFAVLDNLTDISPIATYKDGKLIYDATLSPAFESRKGEFPKEYYSSVKLSPITGEALTLKAAGKSTVKCRSIVVNRAFTQTSEEIVSLPVEDGEIKWEHSDVRLMAVFERYGKNGNVGYGFVGGDTLKKGAVAASYGHDHHNLHVTGENKADMVIAANWVIENQGGMCVVLDGEVIASVKLPVGGLMSEEPMDVIGQQVQQISDAMLHQGYEHYSPIMSLCTVTLPVSPALKLTDMGLIDVIGGKVVDLIVE